MPLDDVSSCSRLDSSRVCSSFNRSRRSLSASCSRNLSFCALSRWISSTRFLGSGPVAASRLPTATSLSLMDASVRLLSLIAVAGARPGRSVPAQGLLCEKERVMLSMPISDCDIHCIMMYACQRETPCTLVMSRGVGEVDVVKVVHQG